MEIKYVGVILTNNRVTNREVKEQITKQDRLAGCLIHCIRYNEYLKQDTEIKIYESLIRPIISYAAETICKAAKPKLSIEVSETKGLWKI